MRVSKLIEELSKIKEDHGDIEVAANGGEYLVSQLIVDVTPYYYDGGCLVIDDKKNWVRSRRHPDLGKSYCYILGIDPNFGLDYEETFEGTPIPYLGEDWDEESYNKNKELFNKMYKEL